MLEMSSMRYCIKWTLLNNFFKMHEPHLGSGQTGVWRPPRAALASDHDAKISHFFHVLSASKHVQPGLK